MSQGYDKLVQDIEAAVNSMHRNPLDFENELEDRGYEILDRNVSDAIAYKVKYPDSQETEDVGLFHTEDDVIATPLQELVKQGLTDRPNSRWGF